MDQSNCRRAGRDGKISRRGVLQGVAGSAVLAPGAAHATAARKPNVLFIMADDMGYGDLKCYGRPDYETPNLDRLASQSVRFERA